MNQSQAKKIVIVGGGTAGWMTANLLISQLKGVEVSLIESKDIGIIGVGEGSTPHLKLFFDAIGVKDSEWMPHCNATYKNGITFANWSQVAGYQSYFHPFAAQLDDLFTVPLFLQNVRARMNGFHVNAHPDQYFLETYLTRNNLAPLPNESFPFGVAYGYHFDSALLGQFLAQKAQSQGVNRMVGNVVDTELAPDGNISAVRCEDGTKLEADYFVDCSGFNSLLLQKGLNVGFRDYKDNLFNDSAVVMPSKRSEKIPVETRSTALEHGWAWQIPLTARFGNGYVYSSNYINSDQAELELRQHLNMVDEDVDVRHLSMKVGRVEKHWHKNCLAVGLSQGFIEPLEATALALTFNTISQFTQCLQQGNFTNQYQDLFNQDINARFEGIRDYIVCHYKANQRQNNQYWQDNANNNQISDQLQHILHLWQHSKNFAEDMTQQKLGGSYQPKSWACLLAGYGLFPNQSTKMPPNPTQYQQELDSVSDFIRRCGLNFVDHNQCLQKQQ